MYHAYVACAVAGGLYLLVSAIFGGIGGIDLDFDLDLDIDLSILSVRLFPIMVFCLFFGLTGLLASRYLTEVLALIPAIPVGLGLAGLLQYLVYVKLPKYEGRAPRTDDAIMKRALVIHRIPPDGCGRISFVIDGNTISGPAKEKVIGDRKPNGINQGSNVYILDIRDNTYYVCEDLEIHLQHQR